MDQLNCFNRAYQLNKLSQTLLWDMIVIGGGATGLGIAVDGASRGYKVLLLEQADFAKGTSSRSTKLVHGGVRYLAQGQIKLVLITPESVGSPTVQEALAGVKFSLFAVDEAHCVSQWGHDFRPAYLGLRRAAQVLGRPPILGLTATATPAIAADVLVQLGMKDANVCRVSFHRPNLAFDVRKYPAA